MTAVGGRAHWESVYTEREPTEVSWFEAVPKLSLQLIDAAGLPPDAAILDVGGGVSSLAEELTAAGYEDVTVADISGTALQRAKQMPGTDGVKFVQADVRNHDFGRSYDLWHDRAVFHFMVSALDQDGYLATLRRTLRAGGHLVIATFGPDAPPRCSGLSVARYGAGELSARLGEEFSVVSATTHIHVTPSGTEQQFLYAHFQQAK